MMHSLRTALYWTSSIKKLELKADNSKDTDRKPRERLINPHNLFSQCHTRARMPDDQRIRECTGCINQKVRS
jgi:hypothetical protein